MQTVGYKEYIDEVAELYPDVDKKAIANLVRHGLIMISRLKRRGNDIYLNHNIGKFYFYFGDIVNNTQGRKELLKKKMRRKLRCLHRLKGGGYSGYYYFGITEKEYQERHLKGLPIDRVILFRVIEEAKLYGEATRFFRVETERAGWLITKENYETCSAEYIQSRIKDGSKSIDYSE